MCSWALPRGAGPSSRGPLRLFGLQLVLNGAWTPIFFGLRQPGLAFAEIVATWLAILATFVAFARTRLLGGVLLLPYLAWVTYATALNWSIWRRNR
jgi:tryptophan-rich sensory protein